MLSIHILKLRSLEQLRSSYTDVFNTILVQSIAHSAQLRFNTATGTRCFHTEGLQTCVHSMLSSAGNNK